MTPDAKRAFARGFPVHVGGDVGRDGFDKADRELTAAFPGVPRDRMLVGLEFAGHHGVTFAHDLARRGYRVVNVLPSVTKKLKEVEDNSPF